MKEDRRLSEKTVMSIQLQGHRKKGQWPELAQCLGKGRVLEACLPDTCGAVRKQVQGLPGTVQCVPMRKGTDTCHMPSSISKVSQADWADRVVTREAI